MKHLYSAQNPPEKAKEKRMLVQWPDFANYTRCVEWWHDGNAMRRAIYAALVGNVLTLVPIFILMLESETATVKLLKSAAATLGVPGVFVGFLLAFGRIDDVDPWVTGIANFAFYFIVSWLILKMSRRRARKVSVPGQ